MTSQAPSCAACGETSGLYWHVYAPDIGNAQLCSCASWRSLDANVERVRARRGLAEPKIRAGDWVECVDAEDSGGAIRTGIRYHVSATESGGNDYSLAVYAGGARPTFWLASRFKRVDGPPPAAGYEETEERVCASCAEGDPRLGEQRCRPVGGKWYCLDTCFPEALERHQETSSSPVGTGNAQSSVPGEVAKPTCSECGAAAELDSTCGMCVYCSIATGEGGDTREEHERIMHWSTGNHPRMVEPRERLAAMAQAERPSGNRAERALLAAGHPVNWPSNEGEE